MADVKRNLEQGGGLFIDKWWSGLYTNRSPLFTPLSSMGLQIIARQDTLIGGLNVTCSPQLTLKRRFGHSRACSVAFGSNEFPLTFQDFQQLNGTLLNLTDTQTNVYSFSSGAKTSIYSKNAAAGQSSFVPVNNTIYWCDGHDAKKWDGTTVSTLGITAPIFSGITGHRLTATNSGSGSLTALIGWQYCVSYRNANTGHVSTTSADNRGIGGSVTGLANTGAFANALQVNVTELQTSSDPQVTNVDIFRTTDGGSVFYYLDTVTNGTSSYTDITIDSALTTSITAPMAHANDPPASGISLMCWYGGRLWAVSGNTLYYSAGPDCINGVGEEAWPPANNFTLPGNITALVPTSQGLIVCLNDNMYVVTGSTSTTFTVPQLWQQNFGVAGPNSATQDGDTVYFYTSRNQVWSYSPSEGIHEVGYNIRDKFAAFTPANVYISLHRSGSDEGVFVSDGATNIYRYSTVNQSWDTVAQPVGGCKALKSLETSSGIWTLLMGRGTGSGYILKRDVTLYQDDGTSYDANAIVGSLIVAPPRQVANIASVLLDVAAVGIYPTLSVLLNEVSDTGVLPATFVALPNPVPDPPQLAASQTVWMKRHDLKAGQSPLSGHVRHLQVKIDFGTQNAASELYTLALA